MDRDSFYFIKKIESSRRRRENMERTMRGEPLLPDIPDPDEEKIKKLKRPLRILVAIIGLFLIALTLLFFSGIAWLIRSMWE
ncbi:MAG: hypothetical protein J1F67_05015 [Muribaculaceae bacterium]|nr:hypothetical protein [Muribaculaceae bacterium]